MYVNKQQLILFCWFQKLVTPFMRRLGHGEAEFFGKFIFI